MGRFGIDVDSLCSYTTEKQVVVRHKWAGLLYYSCIFAVVLYVVIVQVVYNRGYLAFQALSGTVRATYMPPSEYAPLSSLKYCNQSAAANRSIVPLLPCVSWDASLTTQTSASGLLVGTRITRKLQRRNASCYELDYGCSPWYETGGDTVSAYVGGVEDGTILVQHSVSSQSVAAILPGQGDSLDSFGEREAATLSGAHGVSFATVPCGKASTADPRCGSGRGDLFTVGQLLQAAGVDLDQWAANGAEMQRSAGLAVVLSVDYQANLIDGVSRYAYLVNASKLEAKTTFFGSFASTFGAGANATREVFSLHGIQIIFQQTGGLTTFDFFTLLLTFVSGLALVSFSKTITNAFLLYAAPMRDRYRLFLQVSTPDFAPSSEAGSRALDQLLAAKRAKRALCDGERQPSEALLTPLESSSVATEP